MTTNLGCMYVIITFLTFRNDLFLCVWNQFMSIIVEIVTFFGILLCKT